MKIVIGMIVSGVASAAIGAAYMIRHYGLSAQMTDYAQQIANIYQKDYVQILKAVTKEAARLSSYVEGVAAFVTIPVLLVMFHKDRIREKLTGFTPNKKAPLWKYSAVSAIKCNIMRRSEQLAYYRQHYNCQRGVSDSNAGILFRTASDTGHITWHISSNL